MPTQVSKWKSPDGVEFSSPEECAKYEQTLDAVGSALRLLGKRPDGCDFTNGSGWIQHSKEEVEAVRHRLVEISRPRLQWWFDDCKERHGHEPVNAHPSWFARVLDGSVPCLERGWYRLMCIDSEFKEWGQPFYAMNPNDRPKDAVQIDKEPTK